MKRVLTIVIFCIVGIINTEAQILKKGNLIGIHNLEIQLDPDVTMNQFLDYYQNNYIVEAEKLFPGMSISIAKGLRGEHQNEISVFYFFDSSSTRDLYFKDDGNFNEEGMRAITKMQPYQEKLDKLGISTYAYTDWEIR